MAEYCLLTALLTLVVAAIFVYSSGGIQAIWAGANTSLANGSAASATTSPASAPASAPASH